MTNKHKANKFFPDRITIRLPDDVKQMLFEFAKKNDLLDAEFTKDIVIPFMRTKNGVGELETENDSELPPCVYVSISSTPNIVDCGKDFTKKGKIYHVPRGQCLKCWERRTFIREREKTRRTNNIEPKSVDFHERMKEKVSCVLKGSFFPFYKLPCIESLSFECPNKGCLKRKRESLASMSSMKW